MFFSTFRTVLYDFGEAGRRRVRDLRVGLTARFLARHEEPDLPAVRSDYVRDGERPEVFSDRVMDHTRWWWVPLVLGGVVGPGRGWPLSDRAAVAASRREGSPDDVVRRERSDGVPEDYVVPASLTDSETGEVLDHFVRGEVGLGRRVGNAYVGRATRTTTRERRHLDRQRAFRDGRYVARRDLPKLASDLRREVGR